MQRSAISESGEDELEQKILEVRRHLRGRWSTHLSNIYIVSGVVQSTESKIRHSFPFFIFHRCFNFNFFIKKEVKQSYINMYEISSLGRSVPDTKYGITYLILTLVF